MAILQPSGLGQIPVVKRYPYPMEYITGSSLLTFEIAQHLGRIGSTTFATIHYPGQDGCWVNFSYTPTPHWLYRLHGGELYRETNTLKSWLTDPRTRGHPLPFLQVGPLEMADIGEHLYTEPFSTDANCVNYYPGFFNAKEYPHFVAQPAQLQRLQTQQQQMQEAELLRARMRQQAMQEWQMYQQQIQQMQTQMRRRGDSGYSSLNSTPTNSSALPNIAHQPPPVAPTITALPPAEQYGPQYFSGEHHVPAPTPMQVQQYIGQLNINNGAQQSVNVHDNGFPTYGQYLPYTPLPITASSAPTVSDTTTSLPSRFLPEPSVAGASSPTPFDTVKKQTKRPGKAKRKKEFDNETATEPPNKKLRVEKKVAQLPAPVQQAQDNQIQQLHNEDISSLPWLVKMQRNYESCLARLQQEQEQAPGEAQRHQTKVEEPTQQSGTQMPAAQNQVEQRLVEEIRSEVQEEHTDQPQIPEPIAEPQMPENIEPPPPQQQQLPQQMDQPQTSDEQFIDPAIGSDGGYSQWLDHFLNDGPMPGAPIGGFGDFEGLDFHELGLDSIEAFDWDRNV